MSLALAMEIWAPRNPVTAHSNSATCGMVHLPIWTWYAFGVEHSKLMEASMALLQEAPGQQMNIVVLNKALFYFDLSALRDFGNTVTGAKYFALPKGPVVGNYEKKICRDLSRAGLAKQLEDGAAKPMLVVKAIKFEAIGKPELTLAGKIAAFASKFTSNDISDFSHENIGWKVARQRYMPGKQAPEVDLCIAMQQILEEDPWMNEPLDTETARIAGGAKKTQLYNW
jgi:hypothetical protein